MAKMWTAQAPRVLDVLHRDGVSYVKKEYINAKYGHSAWIFLTAYGYLSQQMEKMIPKPPQAESPVWLFHNKLWIGNDCTNLLELEIPEEEMILFDLRKWNKVLSLSFLGTPAEEAAFERTLRRYGLGHSSEVFLSSFYPQLKQEILCSWRHLFDLPEDTRYIQGACWCLKKEWIIHQESVGNVN